MTSHGEPLNSQPVQAGLRGFLPALLISFLISLAIVSPFFWLGNATGHDFQYHAASWLDAAGQWKEGIVYPRWTEWADYGFGEPRFIFYPPFSWMLGASLGSVLPWNHVPIVFIVLVQTFAGLSAFALARRLLPKRAALFCVACYAANPYALLIVYMRSDFAELLANAFFPVLFLLALQIGDLLENPAISKRSTTPRMIASFAAVFAAVWLSNAPAGVIASYSSFALFGFAAITRKSWQPLMRGIVSLALGLGLAGFYILPAAYEQRWVNIAQALSSGLLPSENFLYTVINDPEHTLFNWIASTIAILLMIFTGSAALRIRGGEQDRENGGALDNQLWQAMLLLAGLATVLMLRFTSPLWAVLPKLRFVQFPWRWMSLLSVVFALFLGSAMGRKRWGWIWALATFALIGGTAVVLVQRGWWDTQDIPALRAAIANGEGFDGTDEYDPAGDDHTNLPTKSPQAMVMDTDSIPGPNSRPTIRVERWSPEDKEVSVNSREPFFLGLRLLNYPAWRADVNGAPVAPRGGDDYNQMIVLVPAGESYVHVRFVRTWDRSLGAGISLGTAIFLLWLGTRRKLPNLERLAT
jgi:branched-subunit amino acid transport protein